MRKNYSMPLTLSALILAPLFLTACASEPSNAPHSLTGTTPDQTARWTDQKGHYRPEWRAGINTPPGYPQD